MEDATSGLDEVRTGRGSTGLVRGGRKSRQTDETRVKGKGKGNGGKGKHGSKAGLGSKGTNEAQQSTREKEHEEDERVQVAPNMGTGGSHPQAMKDPGEEDGKGRDGRTVMTKMKRRNRKDRMRNRKRRELEKERTR